ncbi:hypothetical protein F4604DRAFT_1771121 [Suillus subluteus]|nr:hypothetical protein F4604DRAFT_1771121 [Suillus subluteus]
MAMLRLQERSAVANTDLLIILSVITAARWLNLTITNLACLRFACGLPGGWISSTEPQRNEQVILALTRTSTKSTRLS